MAVAQKFIRVCARLRDQYADLIRSRYPNIPRRVSGYSLDELLPQRGFNVAKSLVGAEGTCVITLGRQSSAGGLAQEAHDAGAWL